MYVAVLDCKYSEFVKEEQIATVGAHAAVKDYIDTLDIVCTDALQSGQTAERFRLFAALVGKLDGKVYEIGLDLIHILQNYWLETDAEDKPAPEA